MNRLGMGLAAMGVLLIPVLWMLRPSLPDEARTVEEMNAVRDAFEAYPLYGVFVTEATASDVRAMDPTHVTPAGRPLTMFGGDGAPLIRANEQILGTTIRLTLAILMLFLGGWGIATTAPKNGAAAVVIALLALVGTATWSALVFAIPSLLGMVLWILGTPRST